MGGAHRPNLAWVLFACLSVPALLLAKDDALFDTQHQYTDSSGRYRPEREALHQRIIQAALEKGQSSAKPNLIVSAGAPGAGKSTVLNQLGEQGYLDPSQYVWIDTDELAKLLPEYSTFQKLSPEQTSDLLRKEARKIGYELFLRAIQEKKNVIVDGTLRPTERPNTVLGHIKKGIPGYRTQVIFVDADLDTLLRRVSERAEETGRYVTKSFVIDTKREVGKSVEDIRPYCDYTVEISNARTPTITGLYRGGQNVAPGLAAPLSQIRQVLKDHEIEPPAAPSGPPPSYTPLCPLPSLVSSKAGTAKASSK